MGVFGVSNLDLPSLGTLVPYAVRGAIVLGSVGLASLVGVWQWARRARRNAYGPGGGRS